MEDTTRQDADTRVVRGAAPVEDEPPTQVGRYILIEEIGRGGMGVVYAAWDPELERRVAVKTRAIADPDSLARLRREAQALAQLNHPNVVPIYDVVDTDGGLVVAMELVEGTTLSAWLGEEERAPVEILHAMVEAGRGLAAAHDAELVHRDFKPSNVLIAGDGRVKVADFGLARRAGAGDGSSSGSPGDIVAFSTGTVTGPDEIAGTPVYMSPEQHAGRPLDSRSDQFSYCVVVYEALYGSRPFSRAAVARLRRGEAVEPVPPRRATPGLPRRLWPLLLRGLSARPDDRWASMTVLVDRIDALARQARRRRALPWLAAGVVGIASFVYASLDDPACATDLGLHAVWNKERADAVDRSIRATGVPFAPHVAERVRLRLDDHARAWTEARDALCAAPQPSAATDRCLRRVATSFDAIVGVLEKADALSVENAIENVDRLEAPQACTESAREGPDPPDRAVEAEVEEVTRLVVHARARSRPDLEELTRLVERARAIGYAPLTARAVLALGMGLSVSSERSRGAALIEESFALAEHSRDDAVAAESAIRRAMAALDLGDPPATDQWLRHAEARLERAGDPTQLRLLYLQTSTRSAIYAGELPLAEDRARTLIALAEEAGSATWRHRGVLVLSGILEGRGKYEGAVEAIEGELDRALELFGPDHPHYAGTLLNLGNPLARVGRRDEAVALLRQAIAIFEAEPDRMATNAAAAWSDLANTLTEAGRHEEALDAAARGLDAGRARLDPMDSRLGNALNTYGVALKHAGRNEESIAVTREALAIWEFNHDSRVAIGHLNIGASAEGIGRVEEAAEAYRRAAELQKVSDPVHPVAELANHNLCILEYERDAFTVARDYCREALSIAEQRNGPDSPLIAERLVALAGVERELDPAQAELLARRAHEVVAGSPDADLKALADYTLATSIAAHGGEMAASRARAHAEQALKHLEATTDPDAELLGKVKTWLAEH